MKKMTLCITTHCVKTETKGIYSGINNLVPSTPSTKLVEKIINDFFDKTNLSNNEVNIHIGFDKRVNREVDELYHQNLNTLCLRYENMKIILNESYTDDPIITAPQNFIKLIDSVETPLYFLLEHDWIFNKKIDVGLIIKEMMDNEKINYIRFSQFETNNTVHRELVENSKNPSINIPLMQTFRWSNNPYICKTNIFKDWWKTFVYPTSNEGGFVEGPLNELMSFYIEKMGLELALDRFKCFVYGKWNESPTVSHLNGNSFF